MNVLSRACPPSQTCIVRLNSARLPNCLMITLNTAVHAFARPMSLSTPHASQHSSMGHGFGQCCSRHRSAKQTSRPLNFLGGGTDRAYVSVRQLSRSLPHRLKLAATRWQTEHQLRPSAGRETLGRTKARTRGAQPPILTSDKSRPSIPLDVLRAVVRTTSLEKNFPRFRRSGKFRASG